MFVLDYGLLGRLASVSACSGNDQAQGGGLLGSVADELSCLMGFGSDELFS